MKRFLPLLFALASVSVPAQQIRIAAYNTEGLGAAQSEYMALAKVIANFDVVAAVEVANSGGLEKVVSALDARWEGVMSEKEGGPRNVREFFGFIFNDRIELVKMLGPYPPPGMFSRPPYGAQFKLKGTRFAFNLVACHIARNASERARAAEISRLGDVYRYFENLTGNRGITILAGDFNDDRPKSFESLIGTGDKDVIAVQGTMAGRKGSDPGFDHMFASAALRPRIQKASVLYDVKTPSRRFPVYLVLRAGG